MAKAKKQKPQRLAGAEETCISPEQEAIIRWLRTVKFRKNLLGGVDEAAMWKKLEELYALYEAAIRAERTRYHVLLEQHTGNLPLDTTKVASFAKGSPTGATTTTAAKVDSSAKGSPTRGAGERSETERFNSAPVERSETEGFNPPPASSDPQKEAHSDAPAGQ